MYNENVYCFCGTGKWNKGSVMDLDGSSCTRPYCFVGAISHEIYSAVIRYVILRGRFKRIQTNYPKFDKKKRYDFDEK